MLHPRVQESFEQLLKTWRKYDEAKRARAPYELRLATRTELDRRRADHYRLRRALHPEEREMGEVAAASYCRNLAATVFVSYADAYNRQTFACPCGETEKLPLLAKPALAYTTR